MFTFTFTFTFAKLPPTQLPASCCSGCFPDAVRPQPVLFGTFDFPTTEFPSGMGEICYRIAVNTNRVRFERAGLGPPCGLRRDIFVKSSPSIQYGIPNPKLSTFVPTLSLSLSHNRQLILDFDSSC